jgi:type II secretion system protein G
MKMNILGMMEELRRGFTLIELLVVIVILGILATVGFSSFRTARLKARDAQRKTDASQVRAALEIYYSDRGAYPDDSGGRIKASGASCNGNTSWGLVWDCGSPTVTYMNPLPSDPAAPSQEYRYQQGASTDEYYLEVCLEFSGDTQGLPVASSNAGFTAGNCSSGVIFQVVNP